VPEFGSVDEAFSGVLCILAAAVVLLLVIPLLVFGIELIIIGLVATVTIFARVLLGRPFVVEARCSDHALAWSVTGLRRSRRVIDDVIEALATGSEPAPTDADAQLPGAPAPDMHQLPSRPGSVARRPSSLLVAEGVA